MLPVVPFVWATPTDPLVIALMVAAGAFGSFGHYLLIAGHRLAPASVLAPFIYTELVWVIALGYLVFGDVPNRWTHRGRRHCGRLRPLPPASRTGAGPLIGRTRHSSRHFVSLLPLPD